MFLLLYRIKQIGKVKEILKKDAKNEIKDQAMKSTGPVIRRRRSSFFMALSPSGALDELSTGLLAHIIAAWHSELAHYGESFSFVKTGGNITMMLVIHF